MEKSEKDNQYSGLELAVIGMAARFPGANNFHEFWTNLVNGIESITFLTEGEIREKNNNNTIRTNPDFVPALGGLIEDKYLFDASFFGYTPNEAQVMEPQLRHLYECAWHALEDAGCDPYTYDGLIGVYVGGSSSFNWEARTTLSGKVEDVGQVVATYLMDKDFLGTRLSFKLNLRGPCITIHTACSTSLVTIHMACRSLLTGECDMALAGGVTIRNKESSGYIYQEEMIESPDGHCRTFDKKAKGTVGGEGIGLVVLKRLKYAVNEGDNIYAVIKGSAVNNDGIQKIGFTAPSIEGQTQVIKKALKTAKVNPESITLIEAHGTATPLGDPIEFEALKRAFNYGKGDNCALGSVKTNIGHLDCAAGIAGFIKTVLAIHHRQIPPSLHFSSPNPAMDFEHSPFYVNTELKEWENKNYPLRAGVSSFGIGGTNAHIILEQAPISIQTNQNNQDKQQIHKADEYQLILLSAKSKTALEKMSNNLNEHVKTNRTIDIADIAYTLQVGRYAFKYRKAAVVSTVDNLISSLSVPNSSNIKYGKVIDDSRQKIFLFPGQGSQYLEMGLGLYSNNHIFRKELDHCFEILNDYINDNVHKIIYPKNKKNNDIIFKQTSNVDNHESFSSNTTLSKNAINQTKVAQPLIFIIEYALARLLIHWGIQPDAMLGHSIGEFTAACLSGVFSLEDVISIIVTRGKLVQQMPPGSMLGIELSLDQINSLLNTPNFGEEVELSAINGNKHCTVSGTKTAISEFEKILLLNEVKFKRLHTSHAFHSKMVEPIMDTFAQQIEKVTRNIPQIPFISNVTGKWITNEQAISPTYWASHLRQPVLFYQGLSELLNVEKAVLLEVGPGRVLTTFVRQHPKKKKGHSVTNLLRHPNQEIDDRYYLLEKLGEMWVYGITINWENLHLHNYKNKISLPTYPFERLPYPPQPVKQMTKDILNTKLIKKTDMADWFYLPSWNREDIEYNTNKTEQNLSTEHWLIIEKNINIVTLLKQQIDLKEEVITRVKVGNTFSVLNSGNYIIDPKDSKHYDRLIEELIKNHRIPTRIVHSLTLDNYCEQDNKTYFSPESIEHELNFGYYSLLYLVQAIGKLGITKKIQIIVITNNLQVVTGEEPLSPIKATLIGAVKVIPIEYPNINCRCIDITIPDGEQQLTKIQNSLFIRELMHFTSEPIVCIRGQYRWIQAYQPIRFEKPAQLSPRIRKNGVYLITGGTGGMGFTFGKYLAKKFKARLILIIRSSFPPREQWEYWLTSHDKKEKISEQIHEMLELEKQGARFLVLNADVSKLDQMKNAIKQVNNHFGPINGVLHTAGIPDLGGVIQRRTPEMSAKVMEAKVAGTIVLEQVLSNTLLDFMVLFSSWGTIAYPEKFGQVAYCAANEFLDIYAYYKKYKNETFTVTINWIDWYEVGMTVDAMMRKYAKKIENFDYKTHLLDAVTPEQGIEIFQRIIDKQFPRVILSLKDLPELLKKYRIYGKADSQQSQPNQETTVEKLQNQKQRPEDLSNPYAAPQNILQQKLLEIWQAFFGYSNLGIYDDFFELGGDSLQAKTVINLIQKKINVKIPIPIFFNSPTVEKISEYIPHANSSNYTKLEPKEKREYYSLSSAQKRIYIAQKMEETGTSYNQPIVRILEGKLDLPKLRNSILKLLQRHEILRTSFVTINNEIMQRVHSQTNVSFDFIEISPESKRNDFNQQIFNLEPYIKEFIKPFKLNQLPLFKVKLIQEKENRYILAVDIHHIISDGLSNSFILEEIISIYMQIDSTPLRLQYRDYVDWQSHWLGSEEFLHCEAYWLEKFNGEVTQLELPVDFPRPSQLSYEKGDFVEHQLDSHVLKKLNTLAGETDTTLFMITLATFFILIFKYTGQEDIVVGSPLSGRSHPDLEKMIGVFLNMAALRSHPTNEKSFINFLTEIKENCLDAFENQDYPFDLLIKRLGLQGSANRNPLFDIEFSLQKGSIEEITLSSLKIKPIPRERKFAKYDLHLQVVEEPDQVSLRLRYSLQLFSHSTVEKMLERYIEILEQIIVNPGISIREIKTSYTVMPGKQTADTNDTDDFNF